MPRRIEGPVRLCLDFNDAEDMLDWLEHNYGGSNAAYVLDALDLGRVSSANTFIMKRRGDRPRVFEVRQKETMVRLVFEVGEEG